jgi:hypothetical protein
MHIQRIVLLAFTFYLSAFTPIHAQKTFWQSLFGGSGHDFGKSVVILDDGTLIMAGDVSSQDGLGRGLHGSMSDVVVTRYATQGVHFWQKVIGGTGEDQLSQLIQLSNGDIAFIGTSDSKDGDILTSYGKMDAWVVMMDRQGRVKWSKTYGGSGNDRGICLVEIPGEGLLIGGESGSLDGVMDNQPFGGLDAWIAKIGYDGKMVWNRRYGGKSNEHVAALLKTGPYSFAAAMITNSRDGDVRQKVGADDLWLVGLDEYGRMKWQKTYGGEENESIHSACIDKNGDMVFAGSSFSKPGGIIPDQKGRGDIWVIKCDSSGNMRYSRTFGGTRADGVNKIIATRDGGILVAGTTQSFNGDFLLSLGYYDGYALKLNSYGDKQWVRNLGYTAQDGLYDVIEAPEGGYLAIGYLQQVGLGEIIPGQIDSARAPLPRHAGGFDWWMCNFSDPAYRRGKAYVTPPALVGQVVDGASGRAVEAGITLTDNISLDSLGYTQSDADQGNFAMLLPAYGLASINALAKGYMFYGEDLFMDTIVTKTTIRRTIRLQPIRVGASLVLDKIYFDPGRWELLPESRAELERVIKFLELNNTVRILIGGHTDASGNRMQKIELSEKRANAVKVYLEKAGIPPGRLKIKGYGMSRPVASNRTADGRKRNRRVEFTVTGL